jgi:hypothetical protein
VAGDFEGKEEEKESEGEDEREEEVYEYIWVVLTSCFACILICWLSLFYKSPTLSQETLYPFLSFISRG